MASKRGSPVDAGGTIAARVPRKRHYECDDAQELGAKRSPQIKAEARNPKGDVWWGGAGDPHLQAAEEGLTEEYVSAVAPSLHPGARNQAAAANNRTVDIYAGVLGIGYNSEQLERLGLEPPACWADLTKPDYRGEAQMANPRAFPTCVESAPARSPTRPPTGSYAMGGRVGERAGAE